MLRKLVTLALIGCAAAWAQAGPAVDGVPRYDCAVPVGNQNTALYEEWWTSANDPTLRSNQYRVRSYSTPIWYPEQGTGRLQRVDTGIVVGTDGDAAYVADKNTIQYTLTKDGVSVFKNGQHTLRAVLDHILVQGAEGEQLFRSRSERPAQRTTRVRNTLRTVGMRSYLEHTTRVLNGRIKEDVILHRPPDGVTDAAETVLLVFKWGQVGGPLSITLSDGDICWIGPSGEVAFRGKAPFTYDANRGVIESRYVLLGDGYAIALDAEGLRGATYPVTVDPAYATGAEDALESSSTKNNTGIIYEGCYQKFRLPGLHGATSIDAAVAGFYCGTADADMTFNVFCDIVGAWTESSAYTTLEALAFNAATATGQLADNVNTYEEYDILGSAGTNGIANAYNGTDTPNDVTVKLYRDGSVTQAYKENFFLLGTYDTDYVTFHDNTGEANPPYIEITYTGYDLAVNDNVADSGFHVLYNRSVGEADYNDTGYTAYTSAYALLANPPDLTGKTIQEAWLQVYCSYTYGGGFASTSVYVNDTDASPWNESSTYSTLNGLSMGSASANALNLSSTGYKWVDVTALVQGVYAADSTPETITVKLKQTEDAYTDDTADTVLALGDSAAGYSEDYAAMDAHGLATYMRLYIYGTLQQRQARLRTSQAGLPG